MRVLAALFYLPSCTYLLLLGNAAFALPRPYAVWILMYAWSGVQLHKRGRDLSVVSWSLLRCTLCNHGGS